ncbi:hypothetical protein T439DRAFT_173733 [Meredithblackwellia eburnea MCA 4105]
MAPVWTSSAVVILVGLWALGPGGGAVPTIFLICSVQLFIRLLILPSQRIPRNNALLLGSLVVAQTLSFVFSNHQLSSVLPRIESSIGIFVASLAFTIIPCYALFVGELLVRFMSSRQLLLSACMPATCFALGGLLEEQLGTGRTFWWIQHAGGSAGWLSAWGGQPLVDLVVCGTASSVVSLVEESKFWEEEKTRRQRIKDQGHQVLLEASDLLGQSSRSSSSSEEELEAPSASQASHRHHLPFHTHHSDGRIMSSPDEQLTTGSSILHSLPLSNRDHLSSLVNASAPPPTLPTPAHQLSLPFHRDHSQNPSSRPPSPVVAKKERKFLLDQWSTYIPLLLFAFPILLGILVPNRTITRLHPSPTDPTFQYPPLKVGCISSPSFISKGRRSTVGAPAGSVAEFLHESRVVASRGAKVILWSESAVRLESNRNEKRTGADGWEGMGEAEQQFLVKVQEVADAYRVFLGVTYLLPSARPEPAHKTYNIFTLVGPSLTPSSPPNIIWSITKNVPAPIIESYTHLVRLDETLLSNPGHAPLAVLDIPHRPGTPGPKETPLQQLSLAGAICLDIASPSIFSPFATSPNLDHGTEPRSPSLILNPARTPLASLALTQFGQAQSRAIEHRSFVLRCDSSTGVSGVIAPDGTVRVYQPEQEGSGNWEFELDVEAARGESLWTLTGGRHVGGEEILELTFVLLILCFVLCFDKMVGWEVEGLGVAARFAEGNGGRGDFSLSGTGVLEKGSYRHGLQNARSVLFGQKYICRKSGRANEGGAIG